MVYLRDFKSDIFIYLNLFYKRHCEEYIAFTKLFFN